MPLWTAPEEQIRDRAVQLHNRTYGSDPQILATAPGTFPLVGEHTDYIGGVVAVAMTHLGVAVAASPRSDSKLLVRLSQPGSRDASFESNMEAIAQRKPGSVATRLGGVVWSLINRQMLSRDTQGFDVTVLSTIPTNAGLGEAEAISAAFALGLQAAAEVEIDAPLRARLAEVCTQSASVFAETPELRARHVAALRGHTNSVALVDYADGSVTQAPHPRGIELIVITKPKPAISLKLMSEIVRRHGFLDDAARAYGVDSLRTLPDTRARVTDWLAAVHKVHGTEKVPTLKEASGWLKFLTEETMRASEAAAALRSRRMNAVLQLVRDSQSELENTFSLATETQRALVYLCESRGAVAARGTSPGLVDAVLAYVEPQLADNFAADMSADGLLVIPLHAGTPADAEQVGE